MKAGSPSACALVLGATLASAAADARGPAACDASSMPPDPPGVTTRARIDEIGARYRATLDIETARSRGERVLEAETCEALASSAAVVIAMAAASEAPAPLAEPPRDEAPPKPSPPPSARAPLGVRLSGVADAAMLPSLAAGAGVAVGVDPVARLHLEVHGAAFAAQDGLIDAGRGARFSLWSAGARACWTVARAVPIAPCAGLVVDRLSAEGFGAERVSDGAAIVIAPEGLVSVRVAVAGPIDLRAGVGAIVPTSRPSFVIAGRGAVHEVPAITLRGFFGPEMRF